jgi:hypothetical protein
MSEASQHQGSIELGQRLNAVHTHQDRFRSVSWLPWALLGLLAVAFAAWALLRNRGPRETINKETPASSSWDLPTFRDLPSATPTDRPPLTPAQPAR